MFYNFKIPFIMLIATIVSATVYAFSAADTVQNVLLIPLLWLAISLAGLVITGVHAYATTEEGQDALIHLKYGTMLVDIQWQNIKPTSPVIDVTSIDDLARLAERQGTMILHMAFNALHYYLVQDSDVTYRYAIGAGKEGVVESVPVHNETQGYPAGRNTNSAIRFESLQNKMSRHPSIIKNS